jgi:hypothetical protein
MGITVMTTPDEDGDTTSLVVTNVQVYRIYSYALSHP